MGAYQPDLIFLIISKQAANIEYEKLLAELEKCPEFIDAQKRQAAQWDTENGPRNKAAWEALRESYTAQAISSNPGMNACAALARL
jgi:hypothetical protein